MAVAQAATVAQGLDHFHVGEGRGQFLGGLPYVPVDEIAHRARRRDMRDPRPPLRESASAVAWVTAPLGPIPTG